MKSTIKSTINDILNDFGIASEEQALKNQAWFITLAKVDKYKAEINKYQNKYQIDFAEFEKRLINQINEENFEQENDYLDWKFAVTALKIWLERKEILVNA